ncbi:MAG: DNA-3-methyladenine glycosylase [bacterium]|nr:DNA-3-methyladenine glycosylase [bacterium]
MTEVSFADGGSLTGPALGREFYQCPTDDVARALLGKLLVRHAEGATVVMRITEVEAYLGTEDPACHTFGGRRTPRTETMWGPAGHAYVYLIYGLHHCLNIVTVGVGEPEAVLIRGAIPIVGIDTIRERRGFPASDRLLADGPGKLCQALAITRSDQGCDLTAIDSALFIVDDGFMVDDSVIEKSGRIGVAYAGSAADWPLRYRVHSDIRG